MVLREPSANAEGNCPPSIKVPSGRPLVAPVCGVRRPEVLVVAPRHPARIGKESSDD